MSRSFVDSFIVYSGLVIAFIGLMLIVKPLKRLHVPTRARALLVFAAGMTLATVGLLLPTSESRVAVVKSRLDESIPVWQFSEYHTLMVSAPPERVFAAIERVRAGEITLFNTLTWIRRGGRDLPESILNAGDSPLLDVTLRGGFVRLAHEPPREIVIGTVVAAPPGRRGGARTVDVFRRQLPPGYAIAAMNFLVVPDGPNASIVTTETRVFANSDGSRRRFAAYWRVIYPGSAIIRRSWLRAVGRRAMRDSLP